MIGMNLVKAKEAFFTNPDITKKLSARMKTILSRFGAYVRRRDQTSIKYRKGASEPGSPPSAHRTGARKKKDRKTGAVTMQAVSPLRDLIFFAYSEKSGKQSVVIGPVLFKGHDGTALAMIEQGGEETLKDGRGRTRVGHYQARPHTGPAFLREIEKTLPGLLGGK